MWRFSYRLFHAVAAIIHWSNRRLTAAGMLVLSGVVITGAVGVDTTQSVAYQAFGLLLALIAASALCLPFLRVRVSAERELPRVATAGEPFTYRLRVANLGERPLDGLSIFEDLADPRPSLETFRASVRFPTYRAWKRLVNAQRAAQVPEQPLPELRPHARTEIEVRARALRRGTAHSDGLTVACADPLGLAKALARVPRRSNLIVLPRRYTLPPLNLPGSRRYQPGGVALATSVGDSEEFVGLRDYRPGDPLQRIHWKSFARAARPIVKEYQDEYFERHALVLDTFAAGRDERLFEEAVSIAASFAWTIDTRECLLDLMFIGAEAHTYTAGRGQMQAGNLLEVLAGVQPCRDKPFSVLANAVLSRRHALTGCICVLLGWDEARREFVRRLHSHGVASRVIAVCREPVADPPAWLLAVEPGKVQEALGKL
ncbi:MAG: DUF58 domain-containing protein [Betaproteobacteria bacterium]|nr:DUF58 domain-containing protein [Betaproteobacteria bacterium]